MPNGTRNGLLSRKVFARDCGICQACGCFAIDREAHHVHWLDDGGSDTVDNLVTLCRHCHRGAPRDPAKFLDYQRRGGRFWQGVLAVTLPTADPSMTQSEMMAVFLACRNIKFMMVQGMSAAVEDDDAEAIEDLAAVTLAEHAKVDRARRKFYGVPMPPVECLLSGYDVGMMEYEVKQAASFDSTPTAY